VLGGHYDSRTTSVSDGTSPAPGANDSGSQSALVLEVARAMATYPHDATIVFAAWAGEEQGTVGSRAFVANYRTYFPNGTVEFNFNFDIVGGDNTVNDQAALQQFRLYSPGTPREISAGDGTTDDTSPSRGVMRHIGYWGGLYVPAMAMIPKLREDRPNRGSDHESFIASAIPGVRFIEVNENLAHQHSPDDLYTYVTPTYTARVAQVAVAAAASLARASGPPVSFTAQSQAAGILKVSWAPPASGPAVDHYVVAARPITENFYRVRSSVAASARSATLSAVGSLGIPAGSTYYVSIAAVDAAGHESLFAYPEYRCSTSRCVVPSGSTNVTQTR
jgi:acetylornithine deacetylase/succinyl-diaminopimelate desuccinylase-like protein